MHRRAGRKRYAALRGQFGSGVSLDDKLLVKTLSVADCSTCAVCFGGRNRSGSAETWPSLPECGEGRSFQIGIEPSGVRVGGALRAVPHQFRAFIFKDLHDLEHSPKDC